VKSRAFIIFLLIILCPGIVSGKDVVRVGVLANRGYDECIKKWQPTIEYLSKKIPEHNFQLVPLSFEEITPAVKIAKIDFLICNSGMYVDLEAGYGISRIATIKKKVLDSYHSSFGGVIFTRSDNRKINTIQDLKGKRFLATDPESFGGWLAAWRELHKAGIYPEKDFSSFKFAGNQDTVVFNVIAGHADAGTCRTDLLEMLAKDRKIKLEDIKVIIPEEIKATAIAFPFLVSTRLYPEWPISKLVHTPEEVVNNVSIALLGMKKSDQAAIAAECGGWTYPMNYQSVHELKMELKIGAYKYLGQIRLKDIIKKYWLEIIIGAFAVFIITVSLMLVLFLYKRLLHTKKELDKDLFKRKIIEDALRREKGKLQVEIAERKLAEEKIKHMATHDTLTDLPTMMLAKDRLSMALGEARRYKKIVAVMFIDLDGFKTVNDNLCHDAGDYILKQVAERLRSCMREIDTISRIGGDEFLIIAPEIHIPQNASQIAEKVIHLLSQPIIYKGNPAVVGASIGIALYPNDSEDNDQLIKLADEAMYRIKKAGKNGYCFADASIK